MNAMSLSRAHAAGGDPPGRCEQCRYWDAARGSLEAAIAGLSALGSAYGASVAESRLCRRCERIVSPGDGCRAFSSIESDGLGDGR
ncbi:hypothetical protein [Burkholderia sp. TSV86]|uniref:hypothetical protein n=1 Tax=Burkholderia sp. TSV86 TaxID=1385594 RepID=UPI000759805A|nr:hypothetical protein [Burkholderia sp. TSV86]KVE36611.1 hypothetical protein WS68_03970 [Burkholderia sp. TSV86]